MSYAETKPLDNNTMDLPPEEIKTTWINVHGRKEHEAILRDTDKMHSLGLDPIYEKFKYVRRWGSWLNGSVGWDGKTDAEIKRNKDDHI